MIDRIWETDQRVMAERLAQLESFDVADRLWRIDVPTLILAGARDVIVPVARQRIVADEIPAARFATIAEAGHVGFLTHRGQVVRDVRRHLRRVKETLSPLLWSQQASLIGEDRVHRGISNGATARRPGLKRSSCSHSPGEGPIPR